MGSSYRQDLKGGRMPEWEEQLYTICRHLEIVIDQVLDACNQEDQYDNAAHTGGLAERLSLAKRLIEEELPPGKNAVNKGE